MEYRTFLIKYAEIGTKGKNRYKFEDHLCKRMRQRLKALGDFEVRREYGRIFVDAKSDFDYDEAMNRLTKIFGISGICPVMQIDSLEYEDIAKGVVEYVKEEYSAQLLPEGHKDAEYVQQSVYGKVVAAVCGNGGIFSVCILQGTRHCNACRRYPLGDADTVYPGWTVGRTGIPRLASQRHYEGIGQADTSHSRKCSDVHPDTLPDMVSYGRSRTEPDAFPVPSDHRTKCAFQLDIHTEQEYSFYYASPLGV